MSSMITRPKLGLAAVVAAAALALGACSSAATPTPVPPTAPPTTAASEAPSTAPSAAPSQAAASPAGSGGVYTVAVATGAVGSFLTGEDGKTLYVYAKDTPNSGKSTCNSGCAAAWPPFVLEAGETAAPGAGVTGNIGTITRDDGTQQVSYKGMPVYYFAKDTAAGQTNGQGVGGVWTVAAP